jgi:hypothetical protein
VSLARDAVNGREVEPGGYSGEGTASSFSPRIRRRRAVSLPPIALTLRDLVETIDSGDRDPVVRKRLTEVAQLLQVYARLAELEIAAGERPRPATLRCREISQNASKGGRRAKPRGKSRGRHSWGGSRPSARTRLRPLRRWVASVSVPYS